MKRCQQGPRITDTDIDYLKEGLDTPPVGVWNLGPNMKLGVYLKQNNCEETIKVSDTMLCISLQLGEG